MTFVFILDNALADGLGAKDFLSSMAFGTSAKILANRLLRVFNLRLETLTAINLEKARLVALAKGGHFEQPVFPLVRPFQSMDAAPILKAISRYQDRFHDFEDPSCNEVGYTFANDYFSSPDAEVLYTVIREFQPGTVIEVGSGNSTRLIRQAILDGGLNTRLISIDPQPRAEISDLVDILYRKPVESLDDTKLFQSLKAGDILFIDSSHTVKTGNDVVLLYLTIIPELQPGVLVHIHDIFLPYDYPKDWVIGEARGWNEQYLVQVLLMPSNAFGLLWAGYFLQRSRADFSDYFPHLDGRRAASLWLRKMSG